MGTLVLGIGNTLLTDEGIGVHATRYIYETYPDLPDTRYLDGGTLSFTLAAPVEDADNLIVIDAAQLNENPGTVRIFVGAAMDDYLGGQHQRSVHEVGLMDLMSIVRLAGRLPKHRALIGVQPKSLDWGENPTAEIEAAIPLICEQAVKLIQEWQA
ncbi:MAG: peptidase M52 [Gammaproteobacteria bacterium SG8_15]|nr:MAG: peptidase M52 [Gammaproteobacteria bacterium SG8_15]